MKRYLQPSCRRHRRRRHYTRLIFRKVIRQLERELNVKILPGTELMIDAGAHHFVKASAGSDRVLVPQPSDDPSDPLVSSSVPPQVSRLSMPRELTGPLRR